MPSGVEPFGVPPAAAVALLGALGVLTLLSRRPRLSTQQHGVLSAGSTHAQRRSAAQHLSSRKGCQNESNFNNYLLVFS